MKEFDFYIVKAGETATDIRVAKAINNFGYQQENVFCISNYGYVGEIQTERQVRITLKDFETTDLNVLGQKYIDLKTSDNEEVTQ